MAERQDTTIGVPRRIATLLDDYKLDMRLDSAGEAIETAITLARTAPMYVVAIPIEHALSLCPDEVRESPEDSVIRYVAVQTYIETVGRLLSEQASRRNKGIPYRVLVVPVTSDGGALDTLTMTWAPHPSGVFPMTHAVSLLTIEAINEAVETQNASQRPTVNAGE